MFSRLKVKGLVVAATALVTLAGCSSPGGGVGGDADSVKIGVVTSLSGIQENFGKQYLAGFKAGIDYVTDGSGEIDGKKVEILEADDGTDPAKGAAGATSVLSKGAKIVAGSISTGIALQVAPLAEENDALFLTGAGLDDFSGMSPYVFRTSWQATQIMKAVVGAVDKPKGKKVLVFTQDTTFGKAMVEGLKAPFEDVGATVESVIAPAAVNDLVPFAQRAADADPDFVFVSWVGANASQVWQALDSQGVAKKAELFGLYDSASAAPRTASRGPGSGTSRKTARCSPDSRSRRTCSSPNARASRPTTTPCTSCSLS